MIMNTLERTDFYMDTTLKIAGYCRIPVDEELDRDNTSIENQKMIIKDFTERHFPGSSLTFYEDRDRFGHKNSAYLNRYTLINNIKSQK